MNSANSPHDFPGTLVRLFDVVLPNALNAPTHCPDHTSEFHQIIMKHGTYSFQFSRGPVNCAECGVEIPPERTEANPGTTLCASCQSAAETKKQQGPEPSTTGVYCPTCARKGIKSELVWRKPRDATTQHDFLGCSTFPSCRYTLGTKAKTLEEKEIDQLIAKARDAQILDDL